MTVSITDQDSIHATFQDASVDVVEVYSSWDSRFLTAWSREEFEN